jgi:hypothetical protein
MKGKQYEKDYFAYCNIVVDGNIICPVRNGNTGTC